MFADLTDKRCFFTNSDVFREDKRFYSKISATSHGIITQHKSARRANHRRIAAYNDKSSVAERVQVIVAPFAIQYLLAQAMAMQVTATSPTQRGK